MKKIKILTFIFLVIFVCLITTKVFATSEDTKVYENLKYEINNNEVIITGYNGEPTDINIPSSIENLPVKGIANNAFTNCTSLKSIIIPDSITNLGEAVFMRCTSLLKVTLSSSIKTISANLFNGCTNLTDITIPKGVTKIDGGAFDGTGLINVVIPNSVTEIWYGAFGDCANFLCTKICSKK